MPFWNFSPYYVNSVLERQQAYLASMSWPYGYSINLDGKNYYGNYDYNLDFNAAVQQNIMLHNPFYTPYIPINTNTGFSDIDYARINLATDKNILQAKFEILGTNLNNLIADIDSALGSRDLTDNQKAELENKKAQAENLLKQREDFAKRSPNMEVAAALAEIEGLQGQYYDLRDSVGALKSKIQSGEDVAPTLTPKEIAQQYDALKPTIYELLNNPNVSDEDKVVLQALKEELEEALNNGTDTETLNEIYADLDDAIGAVQGKLAENTEEDDDLTMDQTPIDQMSVDDIKNKYNNEIKPAIRELGKDEYLYEDDKQALKDKQNALRDAIRNGASEEEIKKLYKELQNLITESRAKIEVAKLDENPNLSDEDKADLNDKLAELEVAIAEGGSDQEIQKILNDLNNMIAEAKDDIAAQEADKVEADNKKLSEVKEEYEKAIERYNNSKIAEGGELYEYLLPADKKQLEKWFKAYENAIAKNKPASVVSSIVDNINNIVNTLEENTEKTYQEAVEIAEKIYVASRRNNANFGKKYSEKENIIVENVKKIKKDNVIAVLKAWTAGPQRATNSSGENDICILETIYKEFHWYEWNGKTRYELTEYILTAIEEYAKENKLEKAARPILSTIRGKIAEKDIEGASKEFRRLLQQVLDIPQHYGGASATF